ncbi:MAG: collagen binding domain-containing protein, partial [Planctomycetota bacterium]
VSGLDGTFEIRSLASGKYRIVAQHEKYADSAAIADTQLGNITENVIVKMDRGGAAEGTAINAEGELFAGGEVNATYQPENRGEKLYQRQRSVTIDEKGNFRMEGLAAGEWEFRAKPAYDAQKHPSPGRDAIAAKVNITAGATARVEFILPKGGCAVEGLVTRGGKPSSGATVSIEYKEKIASEDPLERDRLRVATKDDGTFTFQNVRGGEATVTVRTYDSNGSNSNRWQEKATFPESGKFTLNIRIPAGATIEGKVVAKGNGLPLENVTVTAEPVGDVAGEPRRQNASIRTEADGRYRLEGVIPGMYIVTASPQRSSRSTELKKYISQKTGTLSLADGALESLNFQLETGGIVYIETLNESGVATPGIRVLLDSKNSKAAAGDRKLERYLMERELIEAGSGGFNSLQEFRSRFSATSNEKGIAVFEGVEPGDYQIRAERTGYGSVYSDISGIALNQESRGQVQFPAGGIVQISAQILGADGVPVAQGFQYINITDESGRAVYNWFSIYPRSEDAPDGREQSVNLPAGKYTISIGTEKNGSGSLKIEVSGSSQQKFVVPVKSPGKK